MKWTTKGEISPCELLIRVKICSTLVSARVGGVPLVSAKIMKNWRGQFAAIHNVFRLPLFLDMQDFSQLPSKTVTEVLMLEVRQTSPRKVHSITSQIKRPLFQMKMSPAAKTYLISGYPRSMRDVVEYSEKVNWSVRTPLSQINLCAFCPPDSSH